METVIINMWKIAIILIRIIIIPADNIMVIKVTNQDQVPRTRITENVPVIIIIIIKEIISKGEKVIIKIPL